MKKTIILILSLIGVFTISYGQNHTELYNRLEVEKELKEMAKSIIPLLSKQFPEVSQSKWESAAEQANYSKFKQEYIDVLKANYTLAQVKEIFLQNDMVADVNDTGVFLFEPNQATADQLYAVGKKVGRDVSLQMIKIARQ